MKKKLREGELAEKFIVTAILWVIGIVVTVKFSLGLISGVVGVLFTAIIWSVFYRFVSERI